MKKRIISILLAVYMTLCLAPTSVFAERTGDVAINEINFPDEYFRNFVSSNYDKSGSGVLSAEKIAGITEIFCSEEEIESLQGIEFFTALEELCCFDNNLTSLDVGSNTALVTLYCGENSLTSLNVSNNTVLETLSFFLNSLTDVDISKNRALKELNCGCNSLTALDIRNNTALERLWCQENNLTTLDVSRNTALTMLYCWENNLTSLDVSGLSLGDWDFYAEGNIYNIRDAVGTGRTFDLSTLPGNFDVNKASNWNGGTTLTINDGVYTVTYTYDCGEGKTEVFSLTTLQNITSIETIVTAPVIGEKSADSATCVTSPENAAEFRNLVWDKIAEEDFTGTYWFDTWTPMAENETFQSGYYYRVKLYFDAKEDFGFFKNVTGKVNGKDHNGTYGDVYNFEDSSYACLCAVYNPLHIHEAGDEYAYDKNSHWNICAQCDEKMNVAEHTFTWVTDKEATATEKGAKHEECTVCGYEKAAVEIPATGTTPDYEIIEGANGAWTQNSDGTLTFRANGDFGKFTGVKVDGTLIDASNYTAVSGSTVITLKTDYLKTLSVGTHTLAVVYPDGECSTNFEIKTSQSQNTVTTPTESNTPTTPSDADKTNPDTGATSPQTGDNSTMGLLL